MPKKEPPPLPYRAFGARLKELREQARLKQEELAIAASTRSHKISHSLPSQWERGSVRPTIARLDAVIRALQSYGVSVDREELLHLAQYPGYRPATPDALPVDDPAKLAPGRYILSLPAVAIDWLRNLAIYLHLEAVDEAGTGLPGSFGDAAPPADARGTPESGLGDQVPDM